jgi:hypothetical protein
VIFSELSGELIEKLFNWSSSGTVIGKDLSLVWLSEIKQYTFHTQMIKLALRPAEFFVMLYIAFGDKDSMNHNK